MAETSKSQGLGGFSEHVVGPQVGDATSNQGQTTSFNAGDLLGSWAETENSQAAASSRTGAVPPKARSHRAQRIGISLPVIIQFKPGSQEQTQTVFVFARGAVISLVGRVQVGQNLTLKNAKNGKDANCYVVSVEPGLKDSHTVELEFSSPTPDFWPVQFPAEDFSASQPKRVPEAKPAASSSSQPPPITYGERKIPEPIPPVSQATDRKTPVPTSPVTYGADRKTPVPIPPIGQPTDRKTPVPTAPITYAADRKTPVPIPPLSQATDRKTPVPIPQSYSSSKESRRTPVPIEDPVPRPKPEIELVPLAGSVQDSSPTELSSLNGTSLSTPSRTPSSSSSSVTSGPRKKEPKLSGSYDSLTTTRSTRSYVQQYSRTKRSSSAGKWIVAIGSTAALVVLLFAGRAYFSQHHLMIVRSDAVASSIAPPQNSPSQTPEKTAAVPAPAAESAPQPEATPNVAARAPEAVEPIPSQPKVSKKSAAPAPPVAASASHASPAANASPTPSPSEKTEIVLKQAAPLATLKKTEQPEEAPPPAPVLPAEASKTSLPQTGNVLTKVVTEAPSKPAPAVAPASAPQVSHYIPPRLIQQVPPIYPALAKTNHIDGEVVISAVIDSSGNVIHTKVISGPGLLQGAAVNAVSHWKYQPATMNDKPIEHDVEVKVRFSLH